MAGRVIINYLTPKQIEDKYGKNTLAARVTTEYGHLIELPYHASTMTRLHEIAHTHQDTNITITYEIKFKREVEAEVFAYRKMGKPLVPKVVRHGIAALVDSLKDDHNRNMVFNLAMESIKSYNIPCTQKDRSAIWNQIQFMFTYAKNEYQDYESLSKK